MTSAYLFRDADHLKKTFKSDVGQEFIKMAKDQLGIQVITPVYFGSRNVNLKPDKTIKTPADLAGVKLRMPPGEFWQFLGESLGANPTPVAYAELYTALQTGTVDGQDNPLVSQQADEVRRGDLAVRADPPRHRLRRAWSIRSKIWDAMKPGAAGQVPGRRRQGDRREHRQVQRAGNRGRSSTSRRKARRSTSRTRTPSAPSRRRRYVDKYGKDWPKGALEHINAIK